MAVFAGSILSQGPGVSAPALTPILVVPPGAQFNLTGLAFTNTSAVGVAPAPAKEAVNGHLPAGFFSSTGRRYGGRR